MAASICESGTGKVNLAFLFPSCNRFESAGRFRLEIRQTPWPEGSRHRNQQFSKRYELAHLKEIEESYAEAEAEAALFKKTHNGMSFEQWRRPAAPRPPSFAEVKAKFSQPVIPSEPTPTLTTNPFVAENGMFGYSLNGGPVLYQSMPKDGVLPKIRRARIRVWVKGQSTSEPPKHEYVTEHLDDDRPWPDYDKYPDTHFWDSKEVN